MIRTIIWVVILVLVLSFFGVSLRSLVNAPQTHDNFSYLVDLLRNGWQLLVNWVQSINVNAVFKH
jgi:hypothetical protein